MEHLESVETTDLLNILNSRNHCKNPILSISSARFQALLFFFLLYGLVCSHHQSAFCSLLNWINISPSNSTFVGGRGEKWLRIGINKQTHYSNCLCVTNLNSTGEKYAYFYCSYFTSHFPSLKHTWLVCFALHRERATFHTDLQRKGYV